MPSIRLNLDHETHNRLLEEACAERRPADWQAEVLLRRALGLPFPYPKVESAPALVEPITSVQHA